MLVYYMKRAVLEFWDCWSGTLPPPLRRSLSIISLFVVIAVSANIFQRSKEHLVQA
jgi:hypothetical protein